MNLEQQVCSLALAKRLKELGVKQESYAYFYESEIHGLPYIQLFSIDVYVMHHKETQCYAAYTVAELGDILPRVITLNTINYYYTQIPSNNYKVWIIFYQNSFSKMPDCEESDINEANARAKMLVYLLKNGLMELPK